MSHEEKHYCVCGRTDHQHLELCYEGASDEDPSGHPHYPALCCPDCPCLSFALAHPDSEAVPEDFRILAQEELARVYRAEAEKRIQRAQWRASYYRRKARKAATG